MSANRDRVVAENPSNNKDELHLQGKLEADLNEWASDRLSNRVVPRSFFVPMWKRCFFAFQKSFSLQLVMKEFTKRRD
ncbi:MAG: hypothetical protein ACI35P_17885 [Bacillus sp. (in: firmicutes)]